MDPTSALIARCDKWARTDGETLTPHSRLKLFRREEPGEPTRYLQEPSVCLVAQGEHVRQIGLAGRNRQIGHAISWLRLQEARRLMLVEDLDAADAGFRVGYESPSQFSREYARLYGAAPHRDIKALRGA